MEEKILNQLKTVLDPELGLDIVTLGFIRGIDFDRDRGFVKVTMTLTTPLCPMRDQMTSEVKKSLKSIGMSAVDVDYVFSPPWVPPSEVKAILGL